MEYCYVPGTGLKVSRLCVGTMNFGSKLDQAQSAHVVDLALDRGINFFDTADAYADGESERILGRALGARRQEVVVASKVGFPVGAHSAFSLSRGSILRRLEESLDRLGTDYLDVYYLHQPDGNTPFEESVMTMAGLVREGKTRYWGLSNYAAWQFAEAVALCRRYGWPEPVITESTYNALTRGLEREMVPFLREKKRGLAVFNPLAGGLLTGKHRPGRPTPGTRFENPNYQKRYWRDDNFAAVAALERLAQERGSSVLELSLGWCLSRPWVSSVILGFSSAEQFEANLNAALKGPAGPEVCSRFDEVWDMVSGGRVPYNR